MDHRRDGAQPQLFVAVAGASPRTKITTARASAWVSLAAGATVTVTSGDPVYALTLAWALAAVAADGGKSADGDD